MKGDIGVGVMQEVIFEITKDHLETGMRGVPVGYCVSSSVDSLKGLLYAGRPLSEIFHWEPIDVIYLLFHGREGSCEEVGLFYKEIVARSKCSSELIEAIRALPRRLDPMALLSSALLICGGLEGVKGYREDCLHLIAKLPEIVANIIHHHAGWGECSPSCPELGYMENFAQMLKVPNVNLEVLTRIFKLFNVLHYDHGGGSLSAFVGKAVASGLGDMYGAVSSAMNALAGPRHGRANQECLKFIKEAYKKLGDRVTVSQMESFIREEWKREELFFGFGHAVLRVEDPRAGVLYEIVNKECFNNPLVKMANLLRIAGTNILKQEPKISNPYPNVDAISGTLLAGMGFDYPEYFTLLFGLSRCVGISLQIVYERTEARNGRGTPIVRPKFFYKPKEMASMIF